MADILGVNYALEFSDIPSQQAAPGEYGGRVKCMFDSYSGAAGADEVFFGKVPAGARILELSGSGLGTAPTFEKRVDGADSAIAAGDKLASESIMKVTLDGDASATGYALVKYLLD